MSNNRIPSVGVTAQSKVLVSCVSIDGEISKCSSRFGITYECVFNDHDVSIGIYNPFNLSELELSKMTIPYQKIESIQFSVVRLPILSTYQNGPDFGLDIIFQTKDSCVYLETIAFNLISKIVQRAKEKNIPIIDPIGLVNMSPDLNFAEAKERFKGVYDQLRGEHRLQSYRNVDDLNRIFE